MYYRLDDMHNGIKNYLGGKLTFAPLEIENPKRILELGLAIYYHVKLTPFDSDPV